MTFFTDPSFKEGWKYTSFSESERLERLCTDTQNHSQKDLQLRVFPSNADTSSLGSFTPMLSGSVAVGSGGWLDAHSNFMISREQSNIPFSRFVTYKTHQILSNPETEGHYKYLS